MKEALFNELLESVRQGGAILRGERSPSRMFVPGGESLPDVVALRRRYGLSQAKFAALLGVSIGTLRNWEQGRRAPEGPARMLLKVAAKHPEAVLDAAAERGARGRRGRGRRPTIRRTARRAVG